MFKQLGGMFGGGKKQNEEPPSPKPGPRVNHAAWGNGKPLHQQVQSEPATPDNILSHEGFMAFRPALFDPQKQEAAYRTLLEQLMHAELLIPYEPAGYNGNEKDTLVLVAADGLEFMLAFSNPATAELWGATNHPPMTFEKATFEQACKLFLKFNAEMSLNPFDARTVMITKDQLQEVMDGQYAKSTQPQPKATQPAPPQAPPATADVAPKALSMPEMAKNAEQLHFMLELFPWHGPGSPAYSLLLRLLWQSCVYVPRPDDDPERIAVVTSHDKKLSALAMFTDMDLYQTLVPEIIKKPVTPDCIPFPEACRYAQKTQSNIVFNLLHEKQFGIKYDELEVLMMDARQLMLEDEQERQKQKAESAEKPPQTQVPTELKPGDEQDVHIGPGMSMTLSARHAFYGFFDQNRDVLERVYLHNTTIHQQRRLLISYRMINGKTDEAARINNGITSLMQSFFKLDEATTPVLVCLNHFQQAFEDQLRMVAEAFWSQNAHFTPDRTRNRAITQMIYEHLLFNPFQPQSGQGRDILQALLDTRVYIINPGSNLLLEESAQVKTYGDDSEEYVLAFTDEQLLVEYLLGCSDPGYSMIGFNQICGSVRRMQTAGLILNPGSPAMLKLDPAMAGQLEQGVLPGSTAPATQTSETQNQAESNASASLEYKPCPWLPPQVEQFLLTYFEDNRDILEKVYLNGASIGHNEPLRLMFAFRMKDQHVNQDDKISRYLRDALTNLLPMSEAEYPLFMCLNHFPLGMDPTFESISEPFWSATPTDRTCKSLNREITEKIRLYNSPDSPDTNSALLPEIYRSLAKTRLYGVLPLESRLAPGADLHFKGLLENQQRYLIAFTDEEALAQYEMENGQVGHVMQDFNRFCEMALQTAMDGLLINPFGPTRFKLDAAQVHSLAQGAIPEAAGGGHSDTPAENPGLVQTAITDNRDIEQGLFALAETRPEDKSALRARILKDMLYRSILMASRVESNPSAGGRALVIRHNNAGESALIIFTSYEMASVWLSQQREPIELLPVSFFDYCKQVQRATVDYVAINIGTSGSCVISQQELAQLAQGNAPATEPAMPPLDTTGDICIQAMAIGQETEIPDMLRQGLVGMLARQAGLVEAGYFFQLGMGSNGAHELGVGLLVKPEQVEFYEEAILPQIRSLVEEADGGKETINLFVLNHMPGFAEKVRQVGQCFFESPAAG